MVRDGLCIAKIACAKNKYPEQIQLVAMARPRGKKFIFRFTEFLLIVSYVPALKEGRFAIVTSVGRGMRWT
jgi:hypothetical protein